MQKFNESVQMAEKVAIIYGMITHTPAEQEFVRVNPCDIAERIVLTG